MKKILALFLCLALAFPALSFATTSLTVPFRPSDIPTGLVGYWDLNNRANATVGTNLTAAGTPTYSANSNRWKDEYSADLNGSTQYYTAGDNYDMDGKSFSFSFWVKPDSVSMNYVIGKGTSTTDGYAIYIATTVTTYIQSTATTSAGSLVVGKWQHVVVTYNASTTTVSIYFNGNLDKSASNAGSISNVAGAFTVGTRPNNASDNVQNYDGKIKDIAVWEVVLTPLQIKSLALGVDLSTYTYRPSNVSTAPTHFWKLNELSSTRYDSALSGGLNLTITNATKPLNGYIEAVGMWLDAVTHSGSYAYTEDSADYDVGTGDFSFAFWFYYKAAVGTGRLFSIGDYTANGVSCYLASGATLITYVDGSTYSESCPLVVGNWYHMVFRRTSGTVSWVIDGKPYGTPTVKAGDITGSSHGLFIGAWGDSQDSCPNAVYEDFAFWKTYSLSDAECASLAASMPIQQAGIVSYWKGEDTADSFGTMTLTNNNSATFTSGKVGNAFTLVSASSQSLTHADDSSLDLVNPLSISFWIKPTSTGGNASMVGKGEANWAIEQTTTTVRSYYGGTNSYNATRVGLTAGVWTNGVWTNDGIDIKSFQDGSLKDSWTYTKATVPDGTTFTIGNGDLGYFGGQLDEIVLWKMTLFTDEVKALYLKGLNGKEATSTENQPAPQGKHRMFQVF